MVYELKPPVGDSPGLLVFTHKERQYFFDPPAPLAARLDALAQQYVLAMQWGSYHDDVGETPWIDFHLACPGTVDFRPEADVRVIQMCSRDFTPGYFRPMDVPVTWDLLAVGHPIKIKRLSELLAVLRRAYDRGHELRALLVCAVPGDPETLGPKWDHEFFESYHEEFTDAERERIDLATYAEVEYGNRPIHPIPNEVFPYLYNASHSFTLFSEREGQSKVIHEALLCGTPVVVRETLEGGGRDYLDESNSVQFGDLDEATDAFVDIAADPEAYAFDPEPLRDHLVEDRTADVLEERIAAVYDDLDRPYEGEIEKTDLAFKLGGHTLTLPPALRSGNTNDLADREAFVRFVDDSLGRETPLGARLTARRADTRERIEWLRSGGAATLAGRALRRVERSTPIPAYRTARRLQERL